MPRFVAKEDVEKGLVDPTKPLHEQPEYQKKLEKQHQTKQTHQETHTKKQHKEPHHKKEHKQYQQKKQHKEEGQKHQYKQKKPRRQRQDRPQFNWNKKQITLQTKVPDTPKNILPKPDWEKFKNEQNSLKELKENLFLQRKKLIDEQKFVIKSSGDSKKTGFSALSKYGLELREQTNLKKNLYDKKKKLEDERDKIEEQLKALKDQNEKLEHSKDLELMSSQKLREKVVTLEQRLSSQNLTKKQQAEINNSINLAKRALTKSKSDIEIKTEISKNEDKIKILLQQSKTLKKQIYDVYQELLPVKAEINELLQKKKSQEGTITEVKSFEEIKAEYDKKIKEIDAKREEAQKKMDKLKEKYYKDLDLYQDQQDLLRYIKYVQDEIEYKRKKKEEDEKWKKEKEQKQLKRKKQLEEKQKRRQQRKKQEEERRQREEERKQKLQAEKDAYINRNPNWETIDLCEFMIKYCENIRPETQVSKGTEEKGPKGDINLKKQKGWEKEAKSGCEVIVSKKSKLDEQSTKKQKKQTKPKVDNTNDSFSHSIDTMNRFHDLSILPPLNASELDQTIKQLQEKIEILNKPSEEQIEAFKIKAAKQFDRINGFHGQEQETARDQEKHSKQEKRKEKSGKLELHGADFPELN